MKYLIALVIVATTNLAMANSGIGERNVERIIFHDSGKVVVYLSGTGIHGESCDLGDSLILPTNHPLFKEMYSGLLSAMHAGKKVNGWVDGCEGIWGRNSRAKITRLDFLAY